MDWQWRLICKDHKQNAMEIDARFATDCDGAVCDPDMVLRVLYARAQISTPRNEVRMDRLVAGSLDLDDHETLLLEELAGGTCVRTMRAPAHFFTVLKQAISELRLSRLFCSSSQGEFHRSICPAAYDERSGEHHPAEMAEWRAAFRAMAPEQQMMAATIVWMYRSGADSIWLRRVPCTWLAQEALRYMGDAGCLTIWIRLIARFPGW
ncbi:hypothetical protein [Burkholderia sp. LMG 32019]|uniref:hypothetical protein n=1 Tax=Burkholderia sp. LMG 32019 TaxID=3158173 RepID=UPI003C2EAEC0